MDESEENYIPGFDLQLRLDYLASLMFCDLNVVAVYIILPVPPILVVEPISIISLN